MKAPEPGQFTNTIDAQLAVLNERVNVLRQRKQVAAFGMVKAPFDADLHSQMQSIDADLLKVTSAIENLGHARREALKLDGVDTRAQHLAGLQARRDKAVRIASETLPQLAAKITLQILGLSPLLEAFAEARAEASNETRTLAQEVMGSDAYRLRGHNIVAAAEGSMGDEPEALAGVCVMAGLGITGPRRIPGLWHDFGHASHSNLVGAVQVSGDKLKFYLDELLKRVEGQYSNADAVVQAEDRERDAAVHGTGGIWRAPPAEPLKFEPVQPMQILPLGQPAP